MLPLARAIALGRLALRSLPNLPEKTLPTRLQTYREVYALLKQYTLLAFTFTLLFNNAKPQL